MPNYAVDEMLDHSAAAGETFAELVRQALGITPGRRPSRQEIEAERAARRDYLDLLLASHGLASPGMFDRDAIPGCSSDHDRLRGDAATLLRRLHAASHLTDFPPAPINRRVEVFLAEQFGDLFEGRPLRLPGRTLVLDRPGLARELSLPFDADEYRNDLVESYRVLNGVLHNPKSDRRTTSGTFHVVEGPLPVPDDKCEVPRRAFVELFRAACAPTSELATLPYTTTLPVSREFQRRFAWRFVSLVPARSCPTWTLSSPFSGTLVIRETFGMMQLWMSSIGRVTPAASSWLLI